MSRHAERNPEIRPNPSLPLFERSFTKFEQAHARKSDPAQSHKAAASVVNLGPVRDAILQLMGDYGPMSDETLIREYTRYSGMYPKATESGLRTRRSELVRMGFVVAFGEGKTASDRPCTIWRLK